MGGEEDDEGEENGGSGTGIVSGRLAAPASASHFPIQTHVLPSGAAISMSSGAAISMSFDFHVLIRLIFNTALFSPSVMYYVKRLAYKEAIVILWRIYLTQTNTKKIFTQNMPSMHCV